MTKKHNKENILEGRLVSVILALALPIVINSFIQTLYNLIDTYWLGRLGTNSMAAITVVSPIQSIVLNFGQGITVAGAILVSQYIGAKDTENANDMVNQLFVSAMILALISAISCFFATPGIIRWMGAEGEVFEYGKTYLQIVMLDMPFLFMINIFTAVRQSQGDTVKPMLLNLLGVLINMVLDPLFMLTFGWGVAGAAIATVAAKVPCAIIAFIALNNRKNIIRIDLKGFGFNKKKLMSILQIGFPTAIGGSTMQFGFALMSRNVLKYGSMAVAAYGIGNRINGLITMPSNAMGSATATIVGQNVGARQIDRAESAYLLARKMSVIFLFLGGIILSREAVARPIVEIFSSDEVVIKMGLDFLKILALYCWTNGIYNTTTALLQGTGHTVITMAVDATRLWVFRFATLYVCERILNMGVRSIWYSVVISNAISAFILWLIYLSKVWKKNRVRL